MGELVNNFHRKHDARHLPGKVIFLIFLLLFFKLSTASVIPVFDIGAQQNESNVFSVGLIVDHGQTLDIDEIAKIKDSFQIIPPRFTIPSIDANYWFAFKLTNSSSNSVGQILGFDEACIEVANIYYKKDSAWFTEANGLLKPIGLREVRNRCPLFYVAIGPNETRTIYLKMHSQFAVSIGIFTDGIQVFAKKKQLKTVAYWFYFGAAFSLFLYNLFLFIQIRERVYLYYVLYVAFVILWISLYSGFSLYFNTNVKLHYILHASVPLMAAFVTLFTRELLKPKLIKKWIDQALLGITLTYFILAILIVIDIYYYQWLGLFGMASMLFLLYTGLYCMFRQVPLSRFYVIAMSGYLVGLFLIAAVNQGYAPFNTTTRYGFIFGSFIELAVFALALGYRIKLLQEEKAFAQSQLLQTEILMKDNLELQVIERTEELMATTEELESTNEELFKQIDEKDKAFSSLKESEMALLSSNAAKDKFFSILSHDLRSPFNSILGFSDLLIEEVEQNGGSESIGTYAKAIHRTSSQTYNLLLNLLEWSRSQTNGIEFAPQEILLTDLVNELYVLLNNQTDNKGIVVHNNVPSDLKVFADQNMLATILRNLVSNAIKYSHKNDTISIASASLPSGVQISVSDSGVGIADKIKAVLFKIENSVSTLGTNNEKGTGLGLILCKEFVEKHGGKIWLESEVGKGSTFYFTLPDEK
jgi:signal transduction histidine kinase